jgi:CRP-like cAMP-binding protein
MPGQNRLLHAMPLAVLDKLKPRLHGHPLDAGTVLYSAGDRISDVYFMVSGAVSLVTELSGGQMIESAMIGRESVVGGGAALGDQEASHKAIVQVAGSAYALDIDTARRVARESEEFTAAIVRSEQLILAQAQQSAACNAAHDLQSRLARWLLRVRDVTGSDSFVLTQEFIAEMLGVGRTSVSITAHTMQQAGLISYRRGHIRVERFDALQDVACECYGVIRMRYDRLLQPEQPASAPPPARPQHASDLKL